MFNRKVKFTIPQIDNKKRFDNINNELEKNVCASKQHAKEYHDNQHHAKNICLQIGDRVIVKQRKLNKLTPIFEPTSYIVIETNGTFIKAKEENSDRVVTTNISHFLRIPKDAVFPNNTSDESDDDFEDSRHANNANHNQNTRRYPLRNRQPHVDMALHLNTNILISNALYIFHYSRTRYFRFIFFFR